MKNHFLIITLWAFFCTVSDAARLTRNLCYVDGELNPWIKDSNTCNPRVPRGQLGKNLFVEQIFNGSEWVTASETPQCPTAIIDGFPVCGASGTYVRAASPTAGTTRAFTSPPPSNKCALQGRRWYRVRGKLRCGRRRNRG